MHERVVKIVTIGSRKKHQKHRLENMRADFVILLVFIWWCLFLASLFFVWAGISDKRVENVYETREREFYDYSPELKEKDACRIKIKEVLSSISITERMYAPTHWVEYQGMKIDMTREEERGELVERRFYWIRDEKDNTGVIVLEGRQIDRFEQLKEDGKLYDQYLPGTIIRRSVLDGYDHKDITERPKGVAESMKLTDKLEGHPIMEVDFGISETVSVKVGTNTTFSPFFVPGIIALIILLILKYGVRHWFRWYARKPDEVDPDDVVFLDIGRMLSEKKDRANTEEYRNMCLFIEKLLNNRSGWYAIQAKTVMEILSFLGIREKAERIKIYQKIHSPENEARDARQDVFFKLEPKDQGSCQE